MCKVSECMQAQNEKQNISNSLQAGGNRLYRWDAAAHGSLSQPLRLCVCARNTGRAHCVHVSINTHISCATKISPFHFLLNVFLNIGVYPSSSPCVIYYHSSGLVRFLTSLSAWHVLTADPNAALRLLLCQLYKNSSGRVSRPQGSPENVLQLGVVVYDHSLSEPFARLSLYSWRASGKAVARSHMMFVTIKAA